MKIMFASDIHGSKYYCKKMLDAFGSEKAEKLFILGDCLYHGPRNDLPFEYDTKETARLLNEYKKDVFVVRGNCDGEVDQMMLEFPIRSDYALIFEHGRMFFLTHGHVFSQDKMPALNDGDVFISGHTHIPRAEKVDGIVFLNPGSVSIPKGNSTNSYMIYEDGVFTIKDFDGNAVKTYKLD